MSLLSLMPKTKTVFTVLLLALIGFVATQVTMASASTTSFSVSGLKGDIAGIDYVQTNTPDQAHACSNHGSNQACPDDIDCKNTCMSTCASAVFLIPSFVPVGPLSRIAMFLPRNTRVVAYQHPLNAPPPRS